MEISYQSFADSKPFKFLVGKTGKALFIHTKLAAQQSNTLATLVEGGMVEAKREYAVLDDVDEETFIRFMEFAYTGDYAVADPDVIISQLDIGAENTSNHAKNEGRASSPQSIVGQIEEVLEKAFEEQPPGVELEPAECPPPEDPYHDFGNAFTSSHKKKDKKKKAVLWFDDRDHDAPPVPASPDKKSKGEQLWDTFQSKASVKHKSPWKPNVNEDRCEDYTPVFLCHAKLYMFSDKYSIQPLSELVLQKLRLTLSSFKLHSQRIGDVVELLKYTYENTTDYDDGIDRLRNLISDYVVCRIEKIVQHGDFTKLLQENGDVVKDLMPKLVQRLD